MAHQAGHLDTLAVARRACDFYGIADKPQNCQHAIYRRVYRALEARGLEKPFRVSEALADDIIENDLLDYFIKRASTPKKRQQLAAQKELETRFRTFQTNVEQDHCTEPVDPAEYDDYDDRFRPPVPTDAEIERHLDRMLLRGIFETLNGNKTLDEDKYKKDYRELSFLIFDFTEQNGFIPDDMKEDYRRYEWLSEQLSDAANYLSD